MPSWFRRTLHDFQEKITQISEFIFYHSGLLPAGIIFLGLVAVYKEWFLGSGILSYSDWLYIFPESYLSWSLVASSWLSEQAGGVNIFSYFQPIYSLMSALNESGYSFAITERYVFLIPAVTCSYWGMYFYARHLLKDSFSPIFASIVYTCNTYVLVIQTSHLPIFVGLSLIPCIMLFIEHSIERFSLRSAYIASAILLLQSAYEFRIFYITFFLVMSRLGYECLQNRVNAALLIRTVLLSVAIWTLPLVGNLSWIIGLSTVGSLTSNTIFDRTLFGDSFLNVSRSLTLFHPFWTGGEVAAFQVQKIHFLFWLIPMFSFLGLVFFKKDKRFIFWFGISLIGVILTKQSAQPFPKFYEWMFVHFPGFNSFREASKFYILTMFGYSVLIAACVHMLMKLYLLRKISLYKKYFFAILIFSIFALNLVPVVNKSISALIVPRTIPNEYLEFRTHMLQQETFSRTLWVPRRSRWSFYSAQKPLMSFDEQLELWSSMLLTDAERNGTQSQKMKNIIRHKDFGELLNALSIEYIAVPIRDESNDDDFYRYYDDQKSFQDELARIPWLEKIATSSSLFIVRNPHFYDLVRAQSGSNQVDSSFKKITPYQLQVNIHAVTSREVTLEFADAFHPRWEVRGQKSDEVSGTPIPSRHTSSKFGGNSFVIDMDTVCAYSLCEESADGSRDVSFVLYFSPQDAFFAGARTAVVVLISLVGVTLGARQIVVKVLRLHV